MSREAPTAKKIAGWMLGGGVGVLTVGVLSCSMTMLLLSIIVLFSGYLLFIVSCAPWNDRRQVKLTAMGGALSPGGIAELEHGQEPHAVVQPGGEQFRPFLLPWAGRRDASHPGGQSPCESTHQAWSRRA